MLHCVKAERVGEEQEECLSGLSVPGERWTGQEADITR
jgi:hypothetical protein